MFRFVPTVPKSIRRLLLQQCHLCLKKAPCRLRDHCSIYTAELKAIVLVPKQAYQSQKSKVVSFCLFVSDSLSILQALEKLNTDHPLLIQLQRMFPKIDVDQKEIVFMWVPGHVGIRGNEAAVRTAKEVHHKRRTDDLLPFFRPVYLGME